jgi:peptide/nickel transport system substrate-binding protein
VLNNDAPHFDGRQAGQVRPRMSSIAGYRKLDDYTIEITTKEVNSLFPYEALCWFLISSPAQYEKLGRDWNKFAFEPSGTGPFKLTRLVPRERAELVRNPDYWDSSRLPKVDRIILLPIPDVLARTNALLSGHVDLIEGPTPDGLAQLIRAGHRVVQNVTPHVWNYHFSLLSDSPWTDIRLRKAMNLVIDRESIVKMLNGLATPAKGELDRSSPWFGRPSFDLRYDPAEAKRLVAAAGYSVEKPVKAKFVIASGGSGQMLSLPMNEVIQQAAAEIGIQIEFHVVELETAYVHWRKGAKDEINKGITASNIAYVTSDPVYAIVRFLDGKNVAPAGVNWGWYADPKTDALITEVKNTFDPERQDQLLAKLHEIFVDEALLAWVVHDTNPHALSPKVKHFIQAQHWLQDLTTLGVD